MGSKVTRESHGCLAIYYVIIVVVSLPKSLYLMDEGKALEDIDGDVSIIKPLVTYTIIAQCLQFFFQLKVAR